MPCRSWNRRRRRSRASRHHHDRPQCAYVAVGAQAGAPHRLHQRPGHALGRVHPRSSTITPRDLTSAAWYFGPARSPRGGYVDGQLGGPIRTVGRRRPADQSADPLKPAAGFVGVSTSNPVRRRKSTCSLKLTNYRYPNDLRQPHLLVLTPPRRGSPTLTGQRLVLRADEARSRVLLPPSLLGCGTSPPGRWARSP
jgi:hypothetical protein